MHKSEIDGENTGHDANQASDLSRSAARGTSVIPFRRAKSAACPAAGGDPPSPPAPFESLGSVTQAVVLRLANDTVRLKVMTAGPREEETDRQP